MKTAHEILTELIVSFRESIPGVEFKDAFEAREMARSPLKACVTGTVAKESTQGDEWSSKLAFQVLMPRNAVSGGAEGVIGAMVRCAGESQPLFAGMERGGAGQDKATGLTAVGCVFSFIKPGSSGSSGGKKAVYPVEIDGEPYKVTGWKASEGSLGGGLTAIGESVPFHYKGRREFTVELQGLSMESPEELGAFTLRLGSQRVLYKGCRWKSISAGGNCVAAAEERTEEG